MHKIVTRAEFNHFRRQAVHFSRITFDVAETGCPSDEVRCPVTDVAVILTVALLLQMRPALPRHVVATLLSLKAAFATPTSYKW